VRNLAQAKAIVSFRASFPGARHRIVGAVAFPSAAKVRDLDVAIMARPAAGAIAPVASAVRKMKRGEGASNHGRREKQPLETRSSDPFGFCVTEMRAPEATPARPANDHSDP
jgi:hypothetical protein